MKQKNCSPEIEQIIQKLVKSRAIVSIPKRFLSDIKKEIEKNYEGSCTFFVHGQTCHIKPIEKLRLK